mmetsp:Transcript_10472/g.18909  ORF Transcript_10472/g.18909 Transcript_10472/m.18909 type:complete len:173 (-) Transcript_10472:177-695(-)
MMLLWWVAVFCFICAGQGENRQPFIPKSAPLSAAFGEKPNPSKANAKPLGTKAKQPGPGTIPPLAKMGMQAPFNQGLKNMNDTHVKQIHEQQEKHFAMLDEDQSGTVSAAEVQALKDKLNARKQAGEKLDNLETTLLRKMESKDWLDKADKNKDGIITLDEYKFDKHAKVDL